MKLKQRLLPAAGIVLVTLVCVGACRPTRILFFSVLAWMSLWELRSVLASMYQPFCLGVPAVYVLLQSGLCLFEQALGEDLFWSLTFVVFVLCAFLILVLGVLFPSRFGHAAAYNTIAGLVWPCVFYTACMTALRGDTWLPVACVGILAVWACDSMALIIGRGLGKHKIAPSISPNKTRLGCFGGALASLICGAIFWWLFRDSYAIPLAVFMVISLLATTAGQLGDLAASMLKRLCGEKDFSHLLPEHGGILDKTDSILFALPTAALLFDLYFRFLA